MASRDRRPTPAAADHEEPRAHSGATRKDGAAAKAEQIVDDAARVAADHLATAARLARELLVEAGPDEDWTAEDHLATAEHVALDLLATAEEAAVKLLATSQQVAAARLASAHPFEAMFTEHNAVMLLVDPATAMIVDANPAAAAFYGYPVDELRSMSITQINTLPPDEVAADLTQARTREHGHFVFPHRLASGEIRRVDVHSSPIRDDRPLLFSIVVDVEDRVRAQEGLARVSGYARSLIEASLDPLVTISARGVITDVNAATVTVTGVPRKALIGSDFTRYFTDPDRARAGYQEAFTAGSVTDYPLALRNVDGSVTDVLYNATVYRDPDGGVAGVFAAARDVTRAKHAQEALAGQTQRLELVLKSSQLGLWDWNMVTGETVFDERWAQIVGYRLEELQPVSIETWQRLSHPDDLAASDALIEEHAKGILPAYDIECRMRHRDGHWVWVRDRGEVVEWTSDGRPLRMTGTHEDISDRRAEAEAMAEEKERLELVLGSSRLGLWDWNLVTGELILDERWAEIVGYQLADLEPISDETWRRLSHPDDLPASAAAFAAHFSEVTPFYDYEGRLRHHDGGWTWIRDRGKVVAWTPDGEPLRITGTLEDITERHLAEVALQASQAQLEQAQRIAHVGSWTLDNATNHVTWSPELFLMQGLDPAGTVPDYLESGRLFTPESWLRLSTAIGQAQETGAAYELELEMVRPDGSHGWMLARGEAVRDAAGAIVELQGVALDITDRKATEDALQVLATHDSLTGLANRAALLDEITRAVSAGRRSGRATAVLMMDLDRFKDVNDTLGHAVGDDLLVAVAHRIETVMRAGDLAARLGGDEFVVVMRDLDDPTEAARAAWRLVEAFRAPFTLGGVELFATASIGVAIATETSDAGDLVREADSAMYAAKESGRDRVSVFNEDLRADRLRPPGGRERPAARPGTRPARRLVPARGRPRDRDGDRGRGAAALAPPRRQPVDRRPVHRRRRGHRPHPGHRRLGAAPGLHASGRLGRDPPRPAHHRAGQRLRPPARRGRPPRGDRRRPHGQRPGPGPAVHRDHRDRAAPPDHHRGRQPHRHPRTTHQIAIDDFGTGYASLTYLRRTPSTSSRSTAASSPTPPPTDHDHQTRRRHHRPRQRPGYRRHRRRRRTPRPGHPPPRDGLPLRTRLALLQGPARRRRHPTPRPRLPAHLTALQACATSSRSAPPDHSPTTPARRPTYDSPPSVARQASALSRSGIVIRCIRLHEHETDTLRGADGTVGGGSHPRDASPVGGLDSSSRSLRLIGCSVALGVSARAVDHLESDGA